MFHNRFITGTIVIMAGAAAGTAAGANDAELTRTSVVQASSVALLSTAVIAGSTAYTPAQLFPAYGAQLGRPITRESGEAIVEALAQIYERDGYSRPEVRVDHKLANRGILRVSVFEPRIIRVAIEGDAGPHQQTLEELAAPLRNSQPVKRAQVQQVLQSMRELPGLTVTAATKRDSTLPNAFQLDVTTTWRPLDGSLRLTNRGTNEVGPVFMTTQLVANSLLGLDEKVGLVVAAAQDAGEYLGTGLFADLPFGAGRTRGFIMAFRSMSHPNEEPQNLDDDYSRERLTMRTTHQLDARGPVSISLGAALEAENLGIDRSGERLREDRLRVVELGSRFSWRVEGGSQSLATLDIRQGFDALGADLYAPDLREDPRVLDYTIARAQLVRVMPLNAKWTARFDALAQYSNETLPYSERFKIGGDRLGRGFEVTEVAGDRGAGGKLELRRELTPAATRVVGRTSVYGFYDFGAVWSAKGAGPRQSATSGGIGFALNGDRFSGYFEVAKPFTRPDLEGRNSPTLFAELSYRL